LATHQLVSLVAGSMLHVLLIAQLIFFPKYPKKCLLVTRMYKAKSLLSVTDLLFLISCCHAPLSQAAW